MGSVRAGFCAAAGLLAAACGAAPPYLIVQRPPPTARAVLPVAPPQDSLPSTDVEARLLAAHNAERATVGTPPLRWADNLEAEARVWARELIGSNRFAHDPALHGHGENLWTGWGGRVWTPEEMVGEWIAEKADYRHEVFPNVSRTAAWSDVGHYTQLVWRDTTHVGCAVERRGDRSVLACRYAPPGNIDGRRAY
ncbi:MAG: CAP domain-containing protein [Pseudomonadota bacterium]|nr:CAP domain-containing protein [Pseudomonadota bacterium]